jgi:uncharacterized protein
MRLFFALLILIAVGFAANASAASFNCAKARAPDERAICADRRLNDMDVEMAVRLDVAKHLVAMGQRGALMDDQASWLQARHSCRSDKSCLIRHYHDRMLEIRGVLERIYRKGPF